MIYNLNAFCIRYGHSHCGIIAVAIWMKGSFVAHKMKIYANYYKYYHVKAPSSSRILVPLDVQAWPVMLKCLFDLTMIR